MSICVLDVAQVATAVSFIVIRQPQIPHVSCKHGVLHVVALPRCI